jgi:hypothetical protein
VHLITNGTDVGFDWSRSVLSRTKMKGNGTGSLMSLKLKLGANLWPLMASNYDVI